MASTNLRSYILNMQGRSADVLILGAGISGLALAYHLRRIHPELRIAILEKKERAGGWLETAHVEGFSFEKGPRTFSTKRSLPLLQLIRDLGLEEQIIFSIPAAKQRFLYREGKLRKVLSEVFSLLPTLLTEWMREAVHEDESIYTFAVRRFSKKVTERLFDPLTLGIYAGDIQQLSVRSCFPLLKEFEKKWGSVTRGFLHHEKNKEAPLFSLCGGASTLIQTLSKELEEVLHLNEAVEQLIFTLEGVEVLTTQGHWRAEHLFCALPLQAAASLWAPHDPELSALLLEIPCKTIHVVNLGFQKSKVLPSGFGYLVPSSEKESVLGAVFDSEIFSKKSRGAYLTFMVRGEEDFPKQVALEALERHLKITETPDIAMVSTAENAIPQYLVGHEERVQRIENRIRTRFPRCTLLGNYLRGVSVSDCVLAASWAASYWKKRTI